MAYKPEVIKGKVSGTGWPIDGHALYFSLWDYDKHEHWHLEGYDDPEAEVVMQTMYLSEEEAGLCLYDSMEEFAAAFKAGEWHPQGSFVLEKDKVEVLEVLQEEQKDDTRERLREFGIDLSLRESSDRGGIVCLPLDKNLGPDVQAEHPDWEAVNCPHCGQKCWRQPAVAEVMEKQGAQALCTECAIAAGLLTPYRPNGPKPGGSRRERRAAEREYKRAMVKAERRARKKGAGENGEV